MQIHHYIRANLFNSMHQQDLLIKAKPQARASIAPQVWCYFVAFFVLALGAAALGPTLTELAEQTGSELKGISILFSVRALGFLVTARVIGYIYDRSEGHGIMSLSMVIMGTLFFLVPYISQLWFLSSTLFLIGIAGAFIDLGGNILILRAVKNDIGPSLNGLHFSFGLGAFVSPLLIGLLLFWTTQEGDTSGTGIYIFWIISALSFPVAYWIYRTPTPERLEVSKKYAPPPPLSTFMMVLIVLFFFLYGSSEQSFGGWIHTYGVRQNGLTEVAAANLTSVFWGALALGRLLAVPLVIRMKVHLLLSIQVVGTVLVFAAMVLLPNLVAITWVSAGMMGLLMSSIFPLMLAYLERFVAGSGRLTSWFFIGASSGGMTMPWLIGQYFESVGPLFFPTSLMICMAIATGSVFLIMRTLRRNK